MKRDVPGINPDYALFTVPLQEKGPPEACRMKEKSFVLLTIFLTR
jgi:hypothetical protein